MPTDIYPLPDDRGDINRDIQEGIDLLRVGSSDGEAAYTRRRGFRNHWAEHAVSALR